MDLFSAGVGQVAPPGCLIPIRIPLITGASRAVNGGKIKIICRYLRVSSISCAPVRTRPTMYRRCESQTETFIARFRRNSREVSSTSRHLKYQNRFGRDFGSGIPHQTKSQIIHPSFTRLPTWSSAPRHGTNPSISNAWHPDALERLIAIYRRPRGETDVRCRPVRAPSTLPHLPWPARRATIRVEPGASIPRYRRFRSTWSGPRYRNHQ